VSLYHGNGQLAWIDGSARAPCFDEGFPVDRDGVDEGGDEILLELGRVVADKDVVKHALYELGGVVDHLNKNPGRALARSHMAQEEIILPDLFFRLIRVDAMDVPASGLSRSEPLSIGGGLVPKHADLYV
jgi:hypothetical protein